MKSFTFGLVLVIVGVCNAAEIPAEIKGMVAGLREKCHRETGVDIEHVDRTVDGYFHPSETLGCYFSCIFNAFDVLDKDGHVDWDKAITKLDAVESMKEHGMEMINACRTVTGKNPCDAAFNIVQCFHKTNPEKYFVI
uniref:Odorant-binding protein 12 n=1 Tax=Trichogramma dendrolimi TaxID=114056 RepID=A0A2S0BE06_9HYME|nr:odorant-binding protein 12 [Trichogramma dendrolimi]